MVNSILLAIALLAQGVNGLPSNAGSISGVLRTTLGRPAVGVRVTAMAVPQSLLDANTSFSMVSISETDSNGRYRLENIPPGRYYITAGSVDNPTYFPGTMDLAQGSIVSVASQANIPGIDFVQQDSSVRPLNTFGGVRPALSVPVVVQVEGGVRQPVFAFGEFVTLRVVRAVDGRRWEVHLNGSVVRAELPSPVPGAEYRMFVDKLPDGYIVKSMTYGSTDLLTDTLKLTDNNFSQLRTLTSIPSGAGVMLNTGSGNCSFMAFPSVSLMGTTSPISFPPGVAPCISGIANSSVTITLSPGPTSARQSSGVRISGRTPIQSGDWTIYSDNVPGIFYADGSFEIPGVSPGRHIVMLQSGGATPQNYAALVTIGERDLNDVTLALIDVMPANPTPMTATTGAIGPGAFQLPAGLAGRVVEEAGGLPLKVGSVTILGPYTTTTSINADGRFLIPHLLPGSYDLRIEAFEHFTLYATVVIDAQNIEKTFAIRSSLSDGPQANGDLKQ